MRNVIIANWPDKWRWSYKETDTYQGLDGIAIGDPSGTLIFAFQMTWKERLWAVFTGKVYVSQMAFNKPLQPLRVDIREPEIIAKRGASQGPFDCKLCRSRGKRPRLFVTQTAAEDHLEYYHRLCRGCTLLHPGHIGPCPKCKCGHPKTNDAEGAQS